MPLLPQCSATAAAAEISSVRDLLPFLQGAPVTAFKGRRQWISIRDVPLREAQREQYTQNPTQTHPSSTRSKRPSEPTHAPAPHRALSLPRRRPAACFALVLTSSASARAGRAPRHRHRRRLRVRLRLLLLLRLPRQGAVGAAVREARGGGLEEPERPHLPPQRQIALRALPRAQARARRVVPEEFRAATGVPMTVCAAGASPAPQGPSQGQQPAGMASWEPNEVQVDTVMAEPPSAPSQEDVEMLTEEEKAGLCLLGLRESGSATNLNPICDAQGPAVEEIQDAASGDHVMLDVEEIRNVPIQNGCGFSSLLAVTPVELPVGETRYRSERSRYLLESYLKDVRGLLSTGLLEGFKVIYRNNEVENVGRIRGLGYSCGCSECGYRSQVLNACEFEQHSGESSCNQNDRIFLETGISLYRVVKALKHYKLNVLGEFIEEVIGFPPNMVEYKKWKDSFRQLKDDSDAVASDRCSTQSSWGSAVGGISLTDYLKESTSSSISNLNWSVFKRRSGRHLKREGTETSTPSVSGRPDKGIPEPVTGTSKKSGTEEAPNENATAPLRIDGVKLESPGPTAVISDYSKQNPISGSATITPERSPDHSISSKSKEQKTRDTTLHPLLFKEGGLPDNTLLTYKLKNGEALKQGYKRGTCIVCNCCNKEFTPSHFEEHAGMGRRRQPYNNIYTSEGVTLHKLALQLQDRLNSNGFDKANISGFDDYPDLNSPGINFSLTKRLDEENRLNHQRRECYLKGFSRESSTSSRPIVPLKRTLQERVVETESCYFCGDGCTTIGKIDADTIVFCNQCERPCHVKCYNNILEKKKSPLKVLEEYMQFRFLCCEKCQLLRARLDNGLETCKEIAFLRRIGSNICWRILSGMNATNDVRNYITQIIDIFKDAFSETTAEHIGVIAEMVNAKDADGEKDFRGMFCAALTVSAHVVSTAILKVRTEEVAELVLIATRRECRKKGYFVLLLKSIETYLRACNVNILTVPVDPEMAPIWSEKLGFTILLDEEKKSMLEAHPLVMFENLILVQKHLLEQI